MTSAANRLRRHRSRQASGLAVLTVVVNLLDHTEMLIAAGPEFLTRWDENDRKKIEAATSKLLATLALEAEADGRNAFQDQDFD